MGWYVLNCRTIRQYVVSDADILVKYMNKEINNMTSHVVEYCDVYICC
jgi:hypothetical protein